MAFKAFISYSHAADGKLAPTVQRALHGIAKPWYRLRTMRVFRDQANLSASPGLWSSIETALRDSEFFLFMASPTAAESHWVRREVEWWLANRSAQSFLILLTDGEIAWDDARQDFDWSATTALPPGLNGAFSEEPLHTDLRWAKTSEELSVRHSRFRTAILELAATLLNRPKDELDGDDVRQYRRTRRIAWSGVAVLTVLFLAATLSAYLATQERDLAMSRALGTQAEAMISTNPELALLLAREAVRIRGDAQAEYALRRAFARTPLRTLHHAPPGRTVVAHFVTADLVLAAEIGERPAVWSVSEGRRVAEIPFAVSDDFRPGSSADGALLALETIDSAAVYDTRGWKRVPGLGGTRARFSGDGTVLVATAGSELRQWAMPSRREGARIAMPEGYLLRDVSHDGRILFLALDAESSPGLIVETATGRTIARLPERVLREGPVFSPDGTLALTETDGPVFELWSTRTGARVRALQAPEPNDIGWTTYVAFSPDGETVVSGNRNGVLHRWRVATGEWLDAAFEHRNDVREFAFAPDGGSMLSAGAEGTGCLWDTGSMRCLSTFGGQGDDAWDVDVAPDGLHFLSTHLDGTVRVWRRDAWYPRLTIPGELAVVSDDGRLLAVATREGQVQLRDAGTGRLVRALEGSAGEVESLAISPSGSLVAVAPTGGTVGLWDARSGRHLRRLPAASTGTTALTFSADGAQLVTGSEEGAVRFWSVRDGAPIREWAGSGARVTDLLLHPDGERMVVATWDGSAHVRSLASGDTLVVVTLDEEGGSFEDAALSADGRHLLLSGDRVPQIWDLSTLTRVQTLPGHSDEVNSGVFSRDGRLVLTGSGFLSARSNPPEDGNGVWVWDASTRRELIQYRSSLRPVRRVAFAADGTTVIAASMDRVVRVYHCEVCLPLPALSRLVESRSGRALTAEERARYLPYTTLLGWLSSYLPF